MMARVLAYTSTLQAPRRSSGLRPAARHVLVRASAEPSGEPHLGPEPSPRPGRPERASARQVLEEMQQMLADMQQMDPEVQQMRAVVQRLTAKVAGQEQEVSRLHKTLEAIDELSAQVEAGKLSAAATATSLARLSFAWWMQGRWRQADVYTGEELVEMASCAGWPASLDPILSKVLEGRCGYLAVRQLILAELTHLVPAVDALLPLFEPMPPAPDAAWWQAEQLCIVEVMEAVEQQRQAGGRTVPQRLMPYLPMLADYCAAAAEAAAFPEGGTRSLQQFLLAVREDACAPVVTLVAALAAGKLRTRIFVCGGPRLSVQGFSTSAEMMETKRPGPKELLNAQQRLQEAGRVVNWLVHVANPTLAAAAPLQLRGVLASQRMEEDWITWDEWQHHVDVGCPGLGAAAGVATMQLQLHPF